MIRAVKGTRDILPPASAIWNRVESAARQVFSTFNYQEIRTPIFEETALFARGGLEDAGAERGRELAMRGGGETLLEGVVELVGWRHWISS